MRTADATNLVMTLVIITRPEPDASAFAADCVARGWRPVLSPLLEIRTISGSALDPGAVVAFTSANGVRSIAPAQGGTAFAVGEATAAAARDAGWSSVIASGGDVGALAGTIAAAWALRPLRGPVIHIAGSHRAGELVALLAARGVPAERRITYEAVAAAELSPEATSALAAPGAGPSVATFFSARSASIFMDIVHRAGLEDQLKSLAAVCLSSSVAAALRTGAWRAVRIALEPTGRSMLDAISSDAACSDP